MKAFSSMTGQTLRWVQPSIFKQAYELRAGDECIATLRFPKLFSRLARAESAEGCWILEERGIWKSKIVLRPCDQETPILMVPVKHFSRLTTFSLPQWRTIRIMTNFWRTDWSLTTDMGEPRAAEAEAFCETLGRN